MHGFNITIVVGTGGNFNVYGDEKDTIVATMPVSTQLCCEVFCSPLWQNHTLTWRHHRDANHAAEQSDRKELEDKLSQSRDNLAFENMCDSTLQDILDLEVFENNDKVFRNHRSIYDRLKNVAAVVRSHQQLLSIRVEVLAADLSLVDAE